MRIDADITHLLDAPLKIESVYSDSGDSKITLADAILALQSVTDILPACVVPIIDVNGGGKIGLAEVIHILRDTAGMRYEPGGYSAI